MEHNPIINSSDMQLAAEVAHESICTLRRYFLNADLLTKEGRRLLLNLSDAVHNLPLMISPNNKSWRLDELNEDVANCRRLIQQIKETEMYQPMNQGKIGWLKPLFLVSSAVAVLVFFYMLASGMFAETNAIVPFIGR